MAHILGSIFDELPTLPQAVQSWLSSVERSGFYSSEAKQAWKNVRMVKLFNSAGI